MGLYLCPQFVARLCPKLIFDDAYLTNRGCAEFGQECTEGSHQLIRISCLLVYPHLAQDMLTIAELVPNTLGVRCLVFIFCDFLGTEALFGWHSFISWISLLQSAYLVPRRQSTVHTSPTSPCCWPPYPRSSAVVVVPERGGSRFQSHTVVAPIRCTSCQLPTP